jgi:predicted anti-sigma-YlaC factor YlaD
MHRSVREKLEGLVGWRPSHDASASVQDHLSSCAKCRLELSEMRSQAAALRLLRAPEDLAPAPGFYARVRQRIEERMKESIWGVFIYSEFGKRLSYASLALTLLLSGYVIAQEASDGHLGRDPAMVRRTAVVGDRAEQRDAVLVNLLARQ